MINTQSQINVKLSTSSFDRSGNFTESGKIDYWQELFRLFKDQDMENNKLKQRVQRDKASKSPASNDKKKKRVLSPLAPSVFQQRVIREANQFPEAYTHCGGCKRFNKHKFGHHRHSFY